MSNHKRLGNLSTVKKMFPYKSVITNVNTGYKNIKTTEVVMEIKLYLYF